MGVSSSRWWSRAWCARRWAAALAAVVMAGSLSVVLDASPVRAAGESHPVCHDNGDGTFTLISVSRDALFQAENGTLLSSGGSEHLVHSGDIIPPFERNGGAVSESQNWSPRAAPPFDGDGVPVLDASLLEDLDCAPIVPEPTATTATCVVTRIDSDTDEMVFRGQVDTDGLDGFVFFEWGSESDVSDFESADNDTVELIVDGSPVVEEVFGGVNAGPVLTDDSTDDAADIETTPIEVPSGERIYFRLVFGSDPIDPEYTRGDIESCRRVSSGGGSSRPTTPATTVAPETTVPALVDPPADATGPIDDPRGFENTGSDDITSKVSLATQPSSAGAGQGGSITIDTGGDLPPVEVTACTVTDPAFECRIENAGADYDDPLTWESGGFGDECWKEQPGGFSYSLPDPPRPPSGASSSSYTLAVVKSASIDPRPAGWRSTTKFGDPAAGSAVWADANGNGTYDPGVDGDTEIAQIVLCAAVAGASALAVAEGETTTTTPGEPEAIEVVIAPIPGAEPAVGEADLSVGLSVGTDEEFLLVTLDLTDFVFKNAAPETVPTTVVVPQLPVTGAGSGRASQLAVAVLVLGAGVWAIRRRLRPAPLP